jgi:hypothetical protein
MGITLSILQTFSPKASFASSIPVSEYSSKFIPNHTKAFTAQFRASSFHVLYIGWAWDICVFALVKRAVQVQ